MRLDVVFLPRDLQPTHLAGRTVVVFDVLRATTSMAAALAAGVKEIRVFPDTESARKAAQAFDGPRLLCGEERCLPPAGFDLGNSPGAFTREVTAGKTMFLSTTNGTRAIYAARGAAAMFIGALVNASAVAQVVAKRAKDVTLLCSGSAGQISIEDILGAGAVIDALERMGNVEADSDAVKVARRLFRAERNNLPEVLRESTGGQNITVAGLTPDIAFAGRLDVFTGVGEILGDPPVVRAIAL